MTPFLWTKQWCELRQFPHMTYETLGSTNIEAKQNSLRQKEMVLFLSKTQMVGKGRKKNSWLDTKEDCFLSSWILPLKAPPSLLFPALVGLAVHKALQTAHPEAYFGLKAPNDIFMKSGKIGGILIETVSEGNNHRSIVGLGLNVLSAPEISGAAYLAQETKLATEETWSVFLNVLSEEFSHLLEGRHTFRDKKKQQLLQALNIFEKKYKDIDETGSLKLLDGTSVSWRDL